MYLVRDIFGEELAIVGTQFIKAGFGKRFYHRDSYIKGRRLHFCYRNMVRRCYDLTCKEYQWYGAEGVKMCEEWLGEEGRNNFIKWAAATGYQVGLTIDRDVAKDTNYTPFNCKWVSKSLNSRQQRNTKLNFELVQSIRTEYASLPVAERKKFFSAKARLANVAVATIQGLCYCKDKGWKYYEC